MEWESIAKLLISGVLSGVIGLERESVNRPAGFRTHVLVGVGSTLVMVVSIAMMRLYQGADPGRIAAQVVSGIGFLGAGTILRDGANIRGLTTAASLWVVSAIGLAVGAGMYVPAAASTFVAVLTLVILARVERKIVFRRLSTITVVLEDRPGQIGKVATALGARQINIKSIEITEADEQNRLAVTFFVRVPPGLRAAEVAQEIISIPGVHSVEQL